MKLLKRNLQTIYYQLCEGTAVVLDDDDNETGEREVCYSEAYSLEASVSEATGTVAHEQFGLLANYDKVIVTDNVKLPIAEDTVFYLDGIVPSEDAKYNYVVRRIARTKNCISIAVAKVV